MENSILEKEDKYIKDGYKQIYPNNNNVEISMKSWTPVWYGEVEWDWIRSAWGTDKLTVREKFKKLGNIFLEVDSGYYRLRLYLKKETQTQAYRVRKIYLANNNDELISLAETNVKHYNKIVKKIDRIYYNMDKGHLLIIIDEDFISKKEQKLLKEEERTETDKNSIENLFN